jgi:5-methylcytosine-specific restriction endonuclease McrA
VKARRRTGPTDVVKAIVYDRDGGPCVRCGRRDELTTHHRVNRGMGGAREEWINLELYARRDQHRAHEPRSDSMPMAMKRRMV